MSKRSRSTEATTTDDDTSNATLMKNILKLIEKQTTLMEAFMTDLREFMMEQRTRWVSYAAGTPVFVHTNNPVALPFYVPVLQRVSELLDADSSQRLLLAGSPGIGKSTLLEMIAQRAFTGQQLTGTPPAVQTLATAHSMVPALIDEVLRKVSAIVVVSSPTHVAFIQHSSASPSPQLPQQFNHNSHHSPSQNSGQQSPQPSQNSSQQSPQPSQNSSQQSPQPSQNSLPMFRAFKACKDFERAGDDIASALKGQNASVLVLYDSSARRFDAGIMRALGNLKVISVLATSNDPEQYRDYCKDPHSVVYGGPLTKEEMMYVGAMQGLPVDTLEERWRWAGGVVRHFFLGVDTVKQAITTEMVKLWQNKNSYYELENAPRLPHVFIQLPNADGKRLEQTYASDAAMDAHLDYCRQRGLTDAAQLFEGAMREAMPDVAGRYFEAFCVTRLEQGGSFTACNLSDGTLEVVELRANKAIRHSLSTVLPSCYVNCLLVPLKSCFPLYDALYVDANASNFYTVYLFQITVATNHSPRAGLTQIEVSKLRSNLVNALHLDPQGTDLRVKFVWVGLDASHGVTKPQANVDYEGSGLPQLAMFLNTGSPYKVRDANGRSWNVEMPPGMSYSAADFAKRLGEHMGTHLYPPGDYKSGNKKIRVPPQSQQSQQPTQQSQQPTQQSLATTKKSTTKKSKKNM